MRALRGRRPKLDTVPALVKFTAGLIGDLLDGSRPLDVVRAAVYAVTVQKGLLEAGDLEKRIAAVEERLEATPLAAQARQARQGGQGGHRRWG